MGILAAIGEWFAAVLLKLLGKELVDAIRQWNEKRKAEKEAKDSVQPLKDAKNGKEVDDAADDALNGV